MDKINEFLAGLLDSLKIKNPTVFFIVIALGGIALFALNFGTQFGWFETLPPILDQVKEILSVVIFSYIGLTGPRTSALIAQKKKAETAE